MTETEKKSERKSGKGRPVAVYLTILFAVAFLLLLLAYFMQQRSSESMIDTLKSSASNAELLNEMIDENRALQASNHSLQEEVETLQSELAALQAKQTAAEESLALIQADYEFFKLSYEDIAPEYFGLKDALALIHLYESGDYDHAAEIMQKMAAEDYPYTIPSSILLSNAAPSDVGLDLTGKLQEVTDGLLAMGYEEKDFSQTETRPES